MNILLVHPYITVSDLSVDLSEPLGLVSLATYIDRKFVGRVHVDILDLYENRADQPKRLPNGYYIRGNDSLDFFKKALEEKKPDLVGITCNFTSYADDSLAVAAMIKSINPSVPVVMGGAHATMAAKEILDECQFVNFIVRGEGELTFEHLIEELMGEKRFSLIEGLSFRDNEGVVIENNDRELIKDISALPIPDRSFINMSRYMYFPRLTTWYTRKRPIASIMTSRGCPYDCIFCSTKEMWRRHWRGDRVEKIIEEIEMLVSDYGVKEITIFDDQFFTDKKRVEKFCDYFIQRKKRLYFSYDAGVSPWLVDEELLKKMKMAGFYAIRFPIETGNPRTLKFIKKPVNLEKSIEIVAVANRLGYWTSANFILGFPYETREEMQETVKYAYRSGLDFASFIAARPHKGAELYDIYEKEGLLDKGIIHTSVFDVSDYDSTQMKAKEISAMINEASRGWYLNKLKFYADPRNFVRFFLPKIQSFDDFLYAWKMFFRIVRIKFVPLLKRL